VPGTFVTPSTILIFSFFWYSQIAVLGCFLRSPFGSCQPLPTSRSVPDRPQEVEDFLSRLQQLCSGAYSDLHPAGEQTWFVCRVSHASCLTRRSERYARKIVSHTRFQQAATYEYLLKFRLEHPNIVRAVCATLTCFPLTPADSATSWRLQSALGCD
jgi:hypothetical protein